MSDQSGAVLWPLSRVGKALRKPPSPNELVNALHDRVYRDPPMRVIKNVRSIKTWVERCETHPDHQSGMVTHAMIGQRMQEEIDELRDAIAELVKIVERSERKNVREFSHELGKFI